MEFIKEGFTMPVPFNLVPTPKSFVYGAKRIIDKVLKKDKKYEADVMANGSNGVGVLAHSANNLGVCSILF
jgi:hypothetical protein